MLSKSQEKLIHSLRQKKSREETGLCLVEGAKVIETAGTAIEFVFNRNETPNFDKLVTTETPQDIAGVARIPNWLADDLIHSPTLIVLDGVQDPGNVGAILRLCLGFDAGLLLIDSADPSSPKVIRSSAGAMFQVPWIKMSREQAQIYLTTINRKVFRLEKNESAVSPEILKEVNELTIIAGSEGQGIHLPITGTSIEIPHDPRLESLNVTHALAIALYSRQ
jgi:RNA methyltransferase, TrmH family